MDEWNAWGHDAYVFLRSHVRGAVYSTPSMKMDVTEFEKQIRFMVKLYLCLSKFVNFYPTFVRSNAARIRPVFPGPHGLGQQIEESQEWPRLTDTELLRLQRGLLRYELYCRLVGLPSLAASCNRDIYEVVMNFTNSSLVPHIWFVNPFSEFLPIDEVEEIICASTYVRDLYGSLRGDLLDEFHNHILDLNHSRDNDALDNDAINMRKTVGHWLSQDEGQILDFSTLKSYFTFDWTESISRLGLTFLDRMTRSTLAERREVMRSAFNEFLAPYDTHFLGKKWGNVVAHGLYATMGDGCGFGPHCNPMIRTSGSYLSIAQLINSHGAQNRLRRLGWVFFDDKSRIHSLGLPHHTQTSIRNWLHRAENKHSHRFSPRPEILSAALAVHVTEEEWKKLLEKYSPKDYRGDYQAMSQFAAGARAVVNFTSKRLPKID